MEPNFWHNRWEKNQIGFHANEVNPLLVEFFSKLSLSQGSRIFLPLCGKTLDLHWLRSSGYSVVGAELSKKAIDFLFQDLGIKPNINKIENLQHYFSDNIDIFVGDIFHITKSILGKVDAIYDRAALVALPKDMRSSYTSHLKDITNSAPQLLICYEYNQELMDGPPFSISDEEVLKHYKDNYKVNHIFSKPVVGGFKGNIDTSENVWLLEKLS
jgi:thiopurine S-methyltransferase